MESRTQTQREEDGREPEAGSFLLRCETAVKTELESNIGCEKLHIVLLLYTAITLTKWQQTAVLFARTLQRLASASLNVFMRRISLPVVVGVSWQPDLTKASARNCLSNISCQLSPTQTRACSQLNSGDAGLKWWWELKHWEKSPTDLKLIHGYVPDLWKSQFYFTERRAKNNPAWRPWWMWLSAAWSGNCATAVTLLSGPVWLT